jgi:hypothetical protein
LNGAWSGEERKERESGVMKKEKRSKKEKKKSI